MKTQAASRSARSFPFISLIAFVAVVASSASQVYAGATPHMISFGGVSLVRGQSARINVVISNPDLMPSDSTMNVMLSFNIYELLDPADRSGRGTLRFVSHQSAQVTLGAQDGATLNFVVPDSPDKAFFVSGVVIGIDNSDLRTQMNVNATVEVREAKKTLFLNTPVASDLPASTSGQ